MKVRRIRTVFLFCKLLLFHRGPLFVGIQVSSLEFECYVYDSFCLVLLHPLIRSNLNSFRFVPFVLCLFDAFQNSFDRISVLTQIRSTMSSGTKQNEIIVPKWNEFGTKIER